MAVVGLTKAYRGGPTIGPLHFSVPAGSITGFLGPSRRASAPSGRPDLATVVLAVILGLLMDLDATGDAVRPSRAFGDLLVMLDRT